MKYLLTLSFCLFLFLPHFSWAQTEEPYPLEPITVTPEDTGGFVTCGGVDNPCDFCDLVDMTQAIMGFMLQLAIILAVIVLAVAGIRLVVSRGNSSALGAAKESLMNIMIGIVIVVLAFTLVDTLLKVLMGGEFGVWNEIRSEDCGGENQTGGASNTVTIGGQKVDVLYELKSDPDVGYTPALDDGLRRKGVTTSGKLDTYAGKQFDSAVVSKVQTVAEKFDLTVTSGYRTKEYNASVNGSPTSYHLSGRAVDYVGSAAVMQEAANWAKANGAVEVLIHNAGSGTHLHIAW